MLTLRRLHTDKSGIGVTVGGVGRLLIVDDDRPFAAELLADAERLSLPVKVVHDTSTFEQMLRVWSPTIIAMDLVMPDSDGLELIRICGRERFGGKLILMSGGFELYLKMAEEIAKANSLNVVAKLPKPFRPKQFSYLLMSLT
jgi:DNA-binding response OmpR family regulator